jgi:hypothetical protein
VGWTDLLMLEALSKCLSAIFFFVPGRVGTEEAGQAFVFQMLGFGLTRGVGLALVQRLRAFTWSAAGLYFLAKHAVRREP